MRAPWLWFALLAGHGILAAQTLDPDTLTLTVSRASTSLSPDQVGFSITVTTPVDRSLDEVVAMLTDSGVGIADFTGVYTANELIIPQTYWTFSIGRPIQKLYETVSALTKITDRFPGVVRFDIWTGVSAELAATQPCPYPSLASDARTQAQKIAEAAGVKVGPIVAISDPQSIPTDAVQVIALDALTSFLTNVVQSDVGGRLYNLANFGISCAMTVQFKLLR